MKAGITYKQGCHVYTGGHEWWEDGHTVGEITYEVT